MTDPDHLGALIAQRLCHDLVNPLGAIGNGLELLTMTQTETPEMALMRSSLDQALGRIRLYRLAFGLSSDGGRLPGADLGAALQALGGSRPVDLTLDVPADLTQADARLAAVLALCAETALAWGGALSLRLEAGEGAPLRISASAPRLRQDPDAWSALADDTTPPAPSAPLVQFALVSAAARAAGRRLAVEILPDRITVSA